MKRFKATIPFIITILINLGLSLGLLYWYSAVAVQPQFELIADQSFLEEQGQVNYDMPIDAKNFKQYLPEMRLKFAYDEPVDHLIYFYSEDNFYGYNDTEQTIKDSATIGLKYFSTLTDSYEKTDAERLENARMCSQIYTITFDNSSLTTEGLLEEYDYLKSVKLSEGKTLYIFKLKKSCEADAGIGPDQYKRIEKILSQAKIY